MLPCEDQEHRPLRGCRQHRVTVFALDEHLLGACPTRARSQRVRRGSGALRSCRRREVPRRAGAGALASNRPSSETSAAAWISGLSVVSERSTRLSVSTRDCRLVGASHGVPPAARCAAESVVHSLSGNSVGCLTLRCCVGFFTSRRIGFPVGQGWRSRCASRDRTCSRC